MVCELRRTERKKWVLFLLLNFSLVPSVIAELNETDYNYEEYEDTGPNYEMLLSLGKPILQSVLETFAPASDKVENALCRNHSRIYLDELQKGTPWALKMFDASSKIPQGVFHKTLLTMGNFDGCIRTDVTLASNQQVSQHHFAGKYCIALVGMELQTLSKNTSAFLNELVDRKQLQNVLENSFIHLKPSRNSSLLPMFFCIPSSCDHEDLGRSLQSSINNLLMTFGKEVTVDTSEALCAKFDDEALNEGDWIMIGFICLTVLAILLATIYDVCLRRNPSWTEDSGNILFVSFSAYTNVKDLLAPCISDDIIRCLSGIRVLTLAWVVMGHTIMTFAAGLVSNPEYIQHEMKKWYIMPLDNATLSVDSFFLMSGLVLTYVFLKKTAKSNSFNIPMYYITRYLRFSPPFYATVAIFATVMYHTGSGPIWKVGMMTERQNCRDYYWYNLLYIHNYFRMSEMCAQNTWYLAADMQMYWLSPLVLIPIWKRPRIGISLAVILLMATSIATGVITYTHNFSWIIKVTDPAKTLNGMLAMTLTPTHTRAQAYIVGILLGFILHKLRDKPLKLSKVTVVMGWIASTAICLTLVYSVRRIFQDDYVYDATEAAIYSGFFRGTFCICVSWVIFACHKGYGGVVNSFLSWRVWEPLSKLTFNAYLCNTFVTVYTNLTTYAFPHIVHYKWITMFFGNLGMTFSLSIIFYLMFEAPYAKMVKYYMSKRAQKTNNLPHADELKGEEVEINNYVNHSFNSKEDNTVDTVIIGGEKYPPAYN